MIKLFYEGNNYYYENIKEGQAYDINTEIKMNEDASISDVLEAVIRLLRCAGYYPTKQHCLNAIEDIFEDREEY